MALDQVTPDSLVAALRAVPLTRIATCVSGCHTEDGAPDYPALAAATREWIRSEMPEQTPVSGVPAWAENVLRASNETLAEMARRLGL